MNWRDPRKHKPEGNIFWALTAGRPEHDGCDWEIRRLINDEQGDYRTLDEAGSYHLRDSYNGQSRANILFAWLPLESIPINDNDFND